MCCPGAGFAEVVVFPGSPGVPAYPAYIITYKTPLNKDPYRDLAIMRLSDRLDALVSCAKALVVIFMNFH